MEKDEYLPPIMIAEVEGKIQISYDEVCVGIPAEGPVPRDAPPLVCRIFRAFMADLPRDLRAE
ncbi:hypothetical protein SEA_SATIS_51 [Streptomyces phage Satis]|nr:hypothetical protein SEA_SATIS_51 [Streptomyces phage Satis]QBZ71950.1 hypothetical protein SEA_KRADAL_51 [Streptomyces phage Kradal]QPL14368.1 hypothetical protein SEA_EHYELIMAYOE_51 [Streptomyces phage EhyElimayoE]